MLFRIQNETESNKKLREISFKSMLAELPNFFVVLISAIMTGSLIVWVDLLGSFSAEMHSIVIFLITGKIGKNADDSWQFDVARLEVMASLICDTIMIVGYLTLIVGAVPEILDPSAVNGWIVFYFIIKIIAVLVDLYFFSVQKKIYDASPSKVNETETENWKNNLIVDALIGAISIVSFVFLKYEWSRYMSPIATILLSCCFIVGSVRRIRESFNELVNTAVPTMQQDVIIDILLKNRSEYVERIGDIKCYILDRRLNIVVKIAYRKDVTYQQQTELLHIWREAINEKYPDSIVSIELEDGS